LRAHVVRDFLILAIVLTCCTFVYSQQPARPDLSQIVSQMEAARTRAKVTEPFLVTREYRMFHGDEPQPASEVKAEINVVPPNERDYKILESKGSGRGEKVVRKILDHETQAEKKSPPPTAIVHQNYDFAFDREEMFQGTRCYVLLLHPKREDSSLVNGRAWVDANTFMIRKVEGEMAKSPSWWVKDVRLSVQFGEIGGVWTQTATDAVADVRWFGTYKVNGRATKLETVTDLAANRPPRKGQPKTRRNIPIEGLYDGVLLTR
jgi:Outer membrane lipoprotein-sorting protein